MCLADVVSKHRRRFCQQEGELNIPWQCAPCSVSFDFHSVIYFRSYFLCNIARLSTHLCHGALPASVSSVVFVSVPAGAELDNPMILGSQLLIAQAAIYFRSQFMFYLRVFFTYLCLLVLPLSSGLPSSIGVDFSFDRSE